MKLVFALTVLFVSNIACSQHNTKKTASITAIHVGGECEGCEAIHESPIPFDSLQSSTWLPDWNDKGKKLAVNGIVYKADGTPAQMLLYMFIILIKPVCIPQKEMKKVGVNVMGTYAAG